MSHHLNVLQFQASPAYKIPSSNYTTGLAEVFALGGKNSTTRSAYQTDTAFFWADLNCAWCGVLLGGGAGNFQLVLYY